MSLDFDLGNLQLEDVKMNKVKEEIPIEMLDYSIGDKGSLRFQSIKEIEDVEERIIAMTELVRETFEKFSFPEEWNEWYARDLLGLQYTKYEIDAMKREYRIKKKRELKKKKEEELKQKQKAKQMTKNKGEYKINF